MIELVFLACLTASPTNCEQKSMVFTEVSPVQCLMGAQTQLAKWVNEHPKYVVKEYTCRQMRDGEMI